MLLEGKELEGKIGDKGSYSIDVDAAGLVTVTLSGGALNLDGFEVGAFLRVKLIWLIKEYAKTTENKIDDQVVETIEKLLGLQA